MIALTSRLNERDETII